MSFLPFFILGYHGCDKNLGLEVLNQKQDLIFSRNDYDWLGHGIYFWENNPDRALEYATDLSKKKRNNKPTIKDPFVIGAIIDPGNCFDLLDSNAIAILNETYPLLVENQKTANTPLPKNETSGTSGDLLKRKLDCAVIETMHVLNNGNSYDTIRGAFWEGEPIYPGAGILSKSHIQICVRNTACIKGFFLPK